MRIRFISAISVCLFLAFAKTISAQASEDDRPLVVSTASIFADMAEVIAGDVIQVKSIVPLGGDPHTYEPTPEAAKLVTSADLILRNGLTFEGWLNELIKYSGTEAPVSLITKGIEPLGSISYEGSSDPHAWMNAGNGLIYAKNIYRALSLTFPEYADQFDFNYRLYRQEIEQLDAWIQDTVQAIPVQQRVLITSHDAFQYFGAAYGLRLEAILGTSTDADAQTSDVARVIKLIMESKVPSVFIETTVNPKMIRQIADDTGARIGGSLYSDSLGDEESPASTYLEMLRFNTRTIVNALSGANTNLSADDGFEEEEVALQVHLLLSRPHSGQDLLLRFESYLQYGGPADSISFRNVLVCNRRISESLSNKLIRSLSDIGKESGYRVVDLKLNLLSTQTPKRARTEADRLAKMVAKELQIESSISVRSTGLSVFSDEGKREQARLGLTAEAVVAYEILLEKIPPSKGLGLNVD